MAQWTNGQNAFRVLGQTDFATGTAGAIGDSSLDDPHDICLDASNGKMYVVDQDDQRVLRYAYPTTGDGQAAELVFGAPDFTTVVGGTSQNTFNGPRDCAVDSTGRLWVAELTSDRVVWFNSAHSIVSNQPNADGVLGQTNFTDSGNATTQNGMWGPWGITVDGTTLWVADGSNNRVLRFDNAAASANGDNADGVLGQPNFTSGAAATTQGGMSNPTGVVVDASGRLWVADRLNNRVLRFDSAAASANGDNADGVLGQADFVSAAAATTQSGMNGPFDVAIDADGRLYVADTGNERVLTYDNASAASNGANASNVIGQANFTSAVTATTQSGLNLGTRSGVEVDSTNDRLWVADDDNNRVLGFQASSDLPVDLSRFEVD